MRQWNNLSDADKRRLTNLQLDAEVSYARIESVRFWDNFANDPLLGEDEVRFILEVASRCTAPYEAAGNRLRKGLQEGGRGGLRHYQAADIVFNYLGYGEVGIIVMLEIVTAYLTKWATHDEREGTAFFKASVLQNLSRVIGKKLFTAALFRQARKENEGMYKAWSTAFKNWDESKMRTFAKKYSMIEKMDQKEMENCGALAIDLLVKNEALNNPDGPLVYYNTLTVKNREGGMDTVRYVLPCPALMVPLVNSTGTEAILSRMIRRPMLVPPTRHSSGNPGGYLTEMFRGATVKTMGHKWHISKEDLVENIEVLDDGTEITTTRKIFGQSQCSDMNYKVINSLQETEWAVNTWVLDVMRSVFNNNHGQCNLPSPDIHSSASHSLPDFPKDGTKEEQKEWVQLKADLWDIHFKQQQALTQMTTRLSMAESMKNFTFYHQYHYDFRGRVYATCQMLSPQAGDLDRGLVYFATPYEVTEEDIDMICINLTNLFDGQGPDLGFIGTASDKDTFDERIAWARANVEQFRKMCNSPITWLPMWEDDARFKNVSFQRLAAARDFLMALDDGLSRVPVQFDGSCNGYQHWAAMTRDEVSGPEVNLVPRERPGDLYKLVAKGMDTLLDAKSSDESPFIYAFKDHYGPDGVPRKATKRVVMCDPYGLKEHSMKTYIISEGHLKWCDAYDWRFAGPDFEYFETRAATEFAQILKQGLHLVNQRSEEGKQYVMQLTSECADAAQSLEWETPSGFKVVNAYKVRETRTLDQKVYLSKTDCSERVRTAFAVETEVLDCPKMRSTIPPNYVHSLDAAHLQLVSDRMIDAGCTDFSMIHDSFGCPAPFAGAMRNMIRETFYEIHSKPQLELLQAQVEDQLGTAVPAPPPGGDLNILDCLHAEYMFA